MNKLLLPLLIILSTPLFFQSTPTEILKLKIFDAFVITPEPSENFVILNITEEDIKREGGWPLPRQRLAEIQIDLINKGAIGVGWVVSFPQADRLGGDDAFSTSLKYGTSVLAMFEDESGNFPKTTGTIIKGSDIAGIPTTGVVQNIPVLRKHATQGIASAPTEIDNLVRRIPLLLKTPDGFVSAFGTQVLKSLTGSRSYIITTNQVGIQEIAVRGIPPIKTDSLGRKWVSWIKTPETTLKEMEVTGRFVFIGTTAAGIMPQVATPAGLLEPHKIQAALAESILITDSPYIPDWSLAAETGIFLLSVSLIWLVLTTFGITLGITLGATLMLATTFAGYYLIQQGLLIDVTWSLISQFIAGSTAFYLRFREQYKLRQQIKKQFEHYLDPRQVKQLQDNPDLLKLGGEKRYCTFLFTDLRGFTALSEKLSPEEVTEIMNKTLTVQVNAVQKLGGMTDKFIGDAGMFIFGAPLDLEDHETKAVQAAIDIQAGIVELNKTLSTPVQVGVGTQSGFAVVGNMGSETRFDYSAIGDPVNTAARLESATKEVGVDILIGHNTAKNCKLVLKSLKPIKVKGKEKELKIYTCNNFY